MNYQSRFRFPRLLYFHCNNAYSYQSLGCFQIIAVVIAFVCLIILYNGYRALPLKLCIVMFHVSKYLIASLIVESVLRCALNLWRSFVTAVSQKTHQSLLVGFGNYYETGIPGKFDDVGGGGNQLHWHPFEEVSKILVYIRMAFYRYSWNPWLIHLIMASLCIWECLSLWTPVVGGKRIVPNNAESKNFFNFYLNDIKSYDGHRNGRIFIAANLYNNEDILPHWTEQISRLIFMLGGPDKVYVSIYESFSTDSTKSILKQWQRDFLIPLDIPHTVNAEPDDVRDKPRFGQLDDERIQFLASVRNQVMQPFYEENDRIARAKKQFKNHAFSSSSAIKLKHQQEQLRDEDILSGNFSIDYEEETITDNLEFGKSKKIVRRSNGSRNETNKYRHEPFSHILFINDILFLAEDLVKLLLDTNQGNFDMACAMDFFLSGFYDRWVSRDVTGRILSLRYPFIRHGESQGAMASGSFVPMYSCWNGVVWLRAEPFAIFGKNNIRFRARRDRTECFSSECFLLAKDLRSLGYPSVFMHSGVRVAYSLSDWLLWRELLSWPFTRFLLSPKSGLFPSMHEDGLLENGPHPWESDFECITWPAPKSSIK